MRGRLEVPVTVPAGWTVQVNDGGGNDAVTVPAAEYAGPDEFLAAFKTAADTATGRVHTLTRSKGGSGTGILTWGISAASSTTWTSTDMRDYMGYTGNLGSSASHVATNGMQGCWIPVAAMSGPDLEPASTGCLRLSRSQLRGRRGKLYTYLDDGYRSFLNVRWSHVARARAIDGVDTTLISWEAFVRDCLSGGLSYFPITAFQVPTVKVFFDADNDTVLGSTVGGDGIYYAALEEDVAPPMPVEGYTGLRTIEILELIKV